MGGLGLPTDKVSTLVDFHVELPTTPIPLDINAASIASSFASELSHLDEGHFTDNAVWRDVFALTGTLRTFYTPSSIIKAWKETTNRAKAGSFMVNESVTRVARLPTGKQWVEVRFSFETEAVPPTICSGIINLVPHADGKWRIWVLRTILEQLKSQGNVDVLEISTGMSKLKLTNGDHESTNFECVVIGGGQAGLSTGGRLKALGISYVVLDKYKEVGDSWKSRYGSVKLHTTREYAHLPFERTFPAEYREWLTKDDLARGYRNWASKFDINVWTESAVLSGKWGPVKKLWTLEIQKAVGGTRSITSSFVVIAGGGGGQNPVMPEYPNLENFQGVAMHSNDYTTPSQWKGKHGIIVGTANTAHDVAEDMVDAGLSSVTMVQRNKTYVLPVEYYQRVANMSYNDKIPTEFADRATLTAPFAVLDLMIQNGLHFAASKQPERFDALEKAGFKTERYGNLTDCMYRRMGGHYMDVGASAKIAKGLIKMKSDSLPVRYTSDGLEFADGSHLKADVIVFATGFKSNMRYLVQDIFGQEIAGQMGDFWSLDKEGELKGFAKSSGHSAMWYFGGTIGQARFYSRFVALQVKAKLLGTPLEIYSKTP